MKHIYECIKLNGNIKVTQAYENIYNGSLTEQIEVFKKMQRNIEKREQILKYEN